MRRKPSVRYLLVRGSANDSERSDALKPWVKVLLVTVLVTIAAMVLGPIIWPIAEGG